MVFNLTDATPFKKTAIVFFYDKGGKLQQAGWIVGWCQLKVASRSHSSRPIASM
jgi:hypothetical protein